MIIKNVTAEQYDTFISKLQSHQMFYPDTVVNLGMSSRASSYRYNINFGQGQGGIRVDYKHNRHPDTIRACDMRLEFNPSKLMFLEHEYISKDSKGNEVIKISKPAEIFFRILNSHFNSKGDRRISELTGEWSGHVRIIRELDIAFDFNVEKDNIVIMNLSGKEYSLYKGTHYWGAKHSHGYLKMYDKKKERQEKKDKRFDKYEHLTRLEYTIRYHDEIGIPEMDRIKEFGINEMYQIQILDYEKMGKFDPTVKAYLLCYINGLMQEKEMSRRYREKMKKALQEFHQINLDKILAKHYKENVINEIKKYIRLN